MDRIRFRFQRVCQLSMSCRSESNNVLLIYCFLIKQDAMASAANRKYGSNNAGNRGDDSQEEQDNILKCICNICLDNARDAVISLCGHLFWSVTFIFFQFSKQIRLCRCSHRYSTRVCRLRIYQIPSLKDNNNNK